MKNRILFRITAFVLSVLLLSVSVGNAFILTNDISEVHAVLPAVMGLDMMYEICRYYGSLYLGYTLTSERPEVNIHDDDVARIGYQVNKTLWENGFYDGAFHDTPLGHSAVLAAVDYYGQQYVWGSEAFQQIAETDFTVIQGGKNDSDGDDDDNDDDDNIIHFPSGVGDTAKKWFALTAVGAAGFVEFISSEYNKWLHGDSDTLIDEFLAYNGFSDKEIEKQLSGNLYNYSYNVSSYDVHSTAGEIINHIQSSSDSKFPVAGYFIIKNDGSSSVYFYTTNSSGDILFWIGNGKWINIMYGRETVSTVLQYTYSSSNLSYSCNFPMFGSREACEEYLKMGTGYEDAINYEKNYRVADWLADDEYWNKQNLIDPLTGLNALSNWYNIVRHQGLNALGADVSADDLAEYIRDYFAQLGTDVLPEVDPAQAPVKFPSTVEDVIIDPSSNPAVYPSSDPNPGTDPGPGVGTDPGTDTDPIPEVVDIPIEDIVPSVNDSFIDVAGSLRYKFPFSIPWDIQYMLSCLAETPKAPRFELPIMIERYGINEKIIIEMSMFQTLSDLSRSLFSMLFSIFLVNLTFKVVGMRKEE